MTGLRHLEVLKYAWFIFTSNYRTTNETPPLPPSPVSFGPAQAAIIACGTAGEWEKAAGLVHEMEGKGVPPHEICYVAAIRACERAGESEAAAALAEEMDALPPSSRGRATRETSNTKHA